MPFELRVALRYLTARRKQAFVSVISAISVLGVALGVAALIIALGLMTGLQAEIQQRILGATAHVSVFRAGREAVPRLERRRPAVRAPRRRRRRGSRCLRQGAAHDPVVLARLPLSRRSTPHRRAA